MKTLLLIPERAGDEDAGCGPISQSRALNAALCADAASSAITLTYDDVSRDAASAVRLAERLGGPSAGLAMMGFLRRRECDAIYSGSEDVGVALAWLLQSVAHRPMHASAAHNLARGRANGLLNTIALKRGVDLLFVQSQAAHDFAEDRIGIVSEKIALIPPSVDDYFFRPRQESRIDENQIGAAGWRCRDYPILSKAIGDIPDLALKVADPVAPRMASGFPGGAIPAATADYNALRDLYAESSFVAVPLRHTHDAAGAATILQAMAMGKAVIATRTEGQPDLITDGVTGLSVAPGDVAGWRGAICHLRGEPSLRDRLGRNARRWVEEHAAVDRWVGRIAYLLRSAADAHASPAWDAAETQLSKMGGTW